MSSTNRGYDRHKADYYITPQKDVEEFLSVWLYDLEQGPEYNKISARPQETKWLDPCAGGDKAHEMSYPAVLRRHFDTQILATMDIREDSKAETIGDYLTTPTPGFDVIITNPPFYLAKEIIEKALSEVNDGGYVVMLLRLNFLGSKDRRAFFEKHMPESIYVHHKRMCFTEDRKTDSIEYAHFVWRKGYTGQYSKLYMI